MVKQELILKGARFVCLTGLQQRPVYELDGTLYEKAIHFDDGQKHDDFYIVRDADCVAEYLSRKEI